MNLRDFWMEMLRAAAIIGVIMAVSHLFEQYLLYKMVQDKSDLIYGLIMHICTACSLPEGEEYTTDPDEIIENWKESRRCDNMRIVK